MSKIKEGEYVRTRKGITKIKKVNNKKGCALCENSLIVNIKTHKHSKNIIDLIEVGDYVNGHKVVKVKSMIEGKLEVEAQAFLGKYFISYEDIETIVTKELFNSVMYKVGDIE